jgi:hypothetical protein
MMKKITLSALAAVAVVGTAFAGPTNVISSKEYKQPCVTPCFRDQEFQLDLFYSYNDASHQGGSSASDRDTGTDITPITPGLFPASTSLLNNTDVIPAGSTVDRTRNTKVNLPQYFNDGSGGGVGLNYFFAKYFGVGVEGNWWDGASSGFNGTTTATDVVTPSGAVDPVALAAAAKAANTSVTILPDGTLILRKKGDFGNGGRSAANQVTGNLILRYPFEGPICWAPYIFGGGGGIWDDSGTGFGDIGIGVEFRVTPYMGFFTDWRWEFMGGNGSDNGYRDNANIRELADTVGLHNLKNLESNSRNDVNMTRVGIRFVF